MTKKWGTKVENIDVCSPDVLKYIKLPVCITILDPKAIEDVREMLKNQYEYDLVNEVDYLTLKISAYVSCLYNMKKMNSVILAIEMKRYILIATMVLILGG